MIRRVVDTNKQLKQEQKLKPVKRAPPPRTSSAELLLCWMVPVVFVLIALGITAWGILHKAQQPVPCVSEAKILPCDPSDLVIGVMITDEEHANAKNLENSWVAVANNLGIEVLFFGGRKDPSFKHKVVPLEGYNYKLASEGIISTVDGIAAWQYLHTHYGFHKSWFLKVTDKTYVHPHHLVKDVLCAYNKDIPQYIGRKGITKTSTGSIPFAGIGSGYMFTAKTLAEFIHVWPLCKDYFPEEDVTVSVCLKAHLGMDLTSLHSFHPSYSHDLYNKLSKFCTIYPIRGALIPELDDIYFTQCEYKGTGKEAKLVMGDIISTDEEW